MSNFERSREIANPCTYHWDLLVTNFNRRRVSELPITRCLFAYCLLPIACCLLPVAYCLLAVAGLACSCSLRSNCFITSFRVNNARLSFLSLSIFN